MNYDGEAAASIEAQYADLESRYNDIFRRTFAFGQQLRNERAREFFHHGVGRRLEILKRSIDNIFRCFPVRRIEMLERADRLDVEVNLHAFLINVYGIIENLALALAYENELIGDQSMNKIHPKQANLFSTNFQKLIHPTLAGYLRGDMAVWYKEYAKNYRDALAHRIPPYVPPSGLNDSERKRFADIDKELHTLSYENHLDRIGVLLDEQMSLGSAFAVYVHSLSEKAKLVRLHPQMLTDYLTIEELLRKTMQSFFWESPTEASLPPLGI
jgi:hypothetical protein